MMCDSDFSEWLATFDKNVIAGVFAKLSDDRKRIHCPYVGPMKNYGMPDTGLSIKRNTADRCLQACAAEKSMHCSSVKYDEDNQDCTMYTSTRDRYALETFQGSVYYERLCDSKTSIIC